MTSTVGLPSHLAGKDSRRITAYRQLSDIALVSLKSAIFLQFYKRIKFSCQNPTPRDLFHSLKATLYGLTLHCILYWPT